MALNSYENLTSALASWLNRDDLTSIIPDFITMAEADIWGRLRHWEMEKRATVTCDSRYTAIPSDFIEPIRLHLTSKYTALQPMSLNEMADARASVDDTAGEPLYYCLTAGELEVYPSPDASYTLEMNYYAQPDALSASNDQNWLLSSASDVYLYGSLLHSAPFLIDDKRIPVWQSLYEAGLARLQAESERAKFASNLRLRVS